MSFILLLKSIAEKEKECIQFNSDEKELLKNAASRIHIEKDAFLIEKGTMEEHVYLVEQGIFQYGLLRGEHITTFGFIQSGECINTSKHLYHASPSPYYVRAYQESYAYVINIQKLRGLCQKSEAINSIWTIILNNQRRHTFQDYFIYRLPVEQRCEKLLENKKLIQQVLDKDLASYIGITPQAYSNIKKRILLPSDK
ncbi:MAG: cyclic nucleotide-binding domain-containing protein [Mediterranea sp.]|nr:cyclic nucleotide-binding domain-containing protein [Mediterranea sp.]